MRCFMSQPIAFSSKILKHFPFHSQRAKKQNNIKKSRHSLFTCVYMYVRDNAIQKHFYEMLRKNGRSGEEFLVIFYD